MTSVKCIFDNWQNGGIISVGGEIHYDVAIGETFIDESFQTLYSNDMAIAASQVQGYASLIDHDIPGIAFSFSIPVGAEQKPNKVSHAFKRYELIKSHVFDIAMPQKDGECIVVEIPEADKDFIANLVCSRSDKSSIRLDCLIKSNSTDELGYAIIPNIDGDDEVPSTGILRTAYIGWTQGFTAKKNSKLKVKIVRFKGGPWEMHEFGFDLP